MSERPTAIVTGASRGIGAAIAVCLDADGYRVALTGRDQSALADVAAGLDNDPVLIAADLADPDAPAEIVAAATDAFGGRVDVLVNNAGIALRKESELLTAAEIDDLFAVNVRAAILMCTHTVPLMLQRGTGSIVSISSISGLRGAPRRAAYAATKSALDGMTRAIAMEYGPRGIRANAVAPGVVDTAMWRQHLEDPAVEQAVLGVTPQRRLTTAEEVAAVVAFLASDASSSVTGQTISADGGMYATVNLWPQV